MASEKKGKTYEAIVVAAARKVVAINSRFGQVYWNEKPVAMHIEPDVVIGKTLDAPIAIILVTHSASEKNSNQKFWRNIGELVEAKTRLSSIPKVGNFVFDGAFKPDLKTIQTNTFDWETRISEEVWWSDLLAWVDGNADHLPKDSEEKLAAVVAAAKHVSAIRSAISTLEKAITGLLTSKEDASLHTLWDLQRGLAVGQSPAARVTHFRRGLGKCLVVPSILKSTKTWKAGALDLEDSFVAVALGLAKPRIKGVCHVSDPEILSTVSALSLPEAQAILGRQPVDRMRVWIEPLRDLGAISSQFEWIVDHWADLSSPAFMYDSLRRCKLAPDSLGPLRAKSDSKVWLYHLILDVLKTLATKKQAYGLAALLDDIKRLRQDPRHQAVVTRLSRTVGIDQVIWRDDRGVSLGLGDWANGPSKQRFPLNPDDLARIAAALADKVSAASAAPTIGALAELVETVVNTNLEAKLLPYRLFDPVRAQIEIALETTGCAFRFVANNPACFADRVRSVSTLDPRSGGTAVIQVGHTIINWQSAHDSHTNDKRKELTGRAPALRFGWNADARSFAHRTTAKRLFLVLDGTWGQTDIDALLAAGWDDIFYPDEMDRLIKAIV